MRYNLKNIKRLDDGKKVLKTSIPKTIPKKDDDIYIITQETDRLDLLANEFYKDSSLWLIIATANNLNKKFHKNKQKNRNNKYFSLIEDYNYLDKIF